MNLVSSNPQQQAVELLIKVFRPKLAPYVGLKPDMDRAEQAVTGKGCILTLGEIVDCLAEAGLLVDEDVLEVLTYVSSGRGYVGVTPYPDATARKALGRIRDV